MHCVKFKLRVKWYHRIISLFFLSLYGFFKASDKNLLTKINIITFNVMLNFITSLCRLLHTDVFSIFTILMCGQQQILTCDPHAFQQLFCVNVWVNDFLIFPTEVIQRLILSYFSEKCFTRIYRRCPDYRLYKVVVWEWWCACTYQYGRPQLPV